MTMLWDTIAAEAARESALWAAALRPRGERDETPVFSPLGEARYALALETIYEGYLLHYGRPRLFAPADRDTSVLLGDYLFAHGLVRLAAFGNVAAVSDLAELISLCTQLRADNADPESDGTVWAASAALLGSRSAELERARAALRVAGDVEPLRTLALETSGEPAVLHALAAHGERVE
jgi:phage gp46-like protein